MIEKAKKYQFKNDVTINGLAIDSNTHVTKLFKKDYYVKGDSNKALEKSGVDNINFEHDGGLLDDGSEYKGKVIYSFNIANDIPFVEKTTTESFIEKTILNKDNIVIGVIGLLVVFGIYKIYKITIWI